MDLIKVLLSQVIVLVVAWACSNVALTLCSACACGPNLVTFIRNALHASTSGLILVAMGASWHWSLDIALETVIVPFYGRLSHIGIMLATSKSAGFVHKFATWCRPRSKRDGCRARRKLWRCSISLSVALLGMIGVAVRCD